MEKQLFILLRFGENSLDLSNGFYRVYKKSNLPIKISELIEPYLKLKVKDILPLNFKTNEEIVDLVSMNYNLGYMPFLAYNEQGLLYFQQEKMLVEKSENELKVHSLFIEHLKEIVLTEFRNKYSKIIDEKSVFRNIGLIKDHFNFDYIECKIFNYFACEKGIYRVEKLINSIKERNIKYPLKIKSI